MKHQLLRIHQTNNFWKGIYNGRWGNLSMASLPNRHIHRHHQPTPYEEGYEKPRSDQFYAFEDWQQLTEWFPSFHRFRATPEVQLSVVFTNDRVCLKHQALFTKDDYLYHERIF